MWTDKNRARYDRDHLRYPSDLTDDEWAYVEPLIPPARRGGGKRRVDMRAVMNGVMYIVSTGCYRPFSFVLSIIAAALAMASAFAAPFPGTDCRFWPGSSKS